MTKFLDELNKLAQGALKLLESVTRRKKESKTKIELKTNNVSFKFSHEQSCH